VFCLSTEFIVGDVRGLVCRRLIVNTRFVVGWWRLELMVKLANFGREKHETLDLQNTRLMI
jgi:hypothetical protein